MNFQTPLRDFVALFLILVAVSAMSLRLNKIVMAQGPLPDITKTAHST